MVRYVVSTVEYKEAKEYAPGTWVLKCSQHPGSFIIKNLDEAECAGYRQAVLYPDTVFFLLELVAAPTPEYTAVKDSGAREEFPTGSVRDTQEGKGRFDLIDPHAMLRLARHYENGAKKYGDRNWEKGQPSSRYLSSAIRHLFKYLAGMRDEDHLAAAAWNVFAILHNEEVHKEMHDLCSKT